MLILGRKVGQSVIIGDEIKVTVLQIGSKLRLEIDSPKHMNVSLIKQSLKGTEATKIRKVGETVLIGDKVKVSILQVESGLLRFAIDAPKEIGVFREEIYQNKNDNALNYLRKKNFIVFDCSDSNLVSL